MLVIIHRPLGIQKSKAQAIFFFNFLELVTRSVQSSKSHCGHQNGFRKDRKPRASVRLSSPSGPGTDPVTEHCADIDGLSRTAHRRSSVLIRSGSVQNALNLSESREFIIKKLIFFSSRHMVDSNLMLLF